MKTTEQIDAYPVCDADRQRIQSFLEELTEMLLTRADGLTIEVVRDSQFPPLKNGKHLMSEVKIKTWDISA